MDDESSQPGRRPLPWVRTTTPVDPPRAPIDSEPTGSGSDRIRTPGSEQGRTPGSAPGAAAAASALPDPAPDLDPHPEDNRPSRRRPTVSGRPFEPWLAAGDRLPPPGGYRFDPSEVRAGRTRMSRRAPVMATRRGPGRPRNADAERKAFAAVLELFGQRGWAGLSLDAVAAEAGLGKSSIYLRWTDKQALLIDALKHVDVTVVAPDAGQDDGPGVRELLIFAANRRITQYGGTYGPALYRLNIEARIYPEVFDTIWQETIGASIRELTATLLEKAEGVHTPTEEDATDLITSVEGTAMYLAFVAHPAAMPGMSDLHDRIERMVDRHLHGIREYMDRRARGLE
ncbi:TetR/AcrR family transcriptional regulator [Georgenia sp. Z1491]|uniref:TetR/AcrR family transcriptional regulator n=1 Tax=Georgenia sp. Z1491 TaxID=3416707 RepID=UPI003CF267B0